MTKILKLGTILSVFTFALSSISCNKVSDFENTNVNPAGTGTPVTAALLTNVLSGIGGYATSIRGGHYAQYFSETQYPGSSIYTAPILSFSGTYAAELYDLQNIINQNTDPATKGLVIGSGSTNNQIAIARILKAYIFWTITDRWGDIPYFEALKGLDKKFTPKYDTQQEIYVDLVKELKEAVAQFDNVSVFKGDILMNYAASTSPTTVNAKWKKFANSLRMLIALRTSKVYPNAGQWAATEFNAALTDAGGIITANSENVALTYPGSTFPNPWNSTYVVSARVDDAESKTMTDALNAVNDPRIASFGTASTGFPYGLDRPRAVLVPLGFAYVLKGASTPATDPVMILNASTVTLARAEAAERGWTTEIAATLYASAISLSFTQYGYTTTQATNYIAQPEIAYGSNNLAKIGQQRWFALYPNGFQAWFEWRRTGFPALTPAPYATNPGGQIPRRYIYGTDEYSTNGTNVKASAAKLTGGDTQDARVWWDK